MPKNFQYVAETGRNEFLRANPQLANEFVAHLLESYDVTFRESSVLCKKEFCGPLANKINITVHPTNRRNFHVPLRF